MESDGPTRLELHDYLSICVWPKSSPNRFNFTTSFLINIFAGPVSTVYTTVK